MTDIAVFVDRVVVSTVLIINTVVITTMLLAIAVTDKYDENRSARVYNQARCASSGCTAMAATSTEPTATAEVRVRLGN